MEAIIGIVLLIGAWVLFNMVLNAGARTVKAAARAVVGKGTFSENMELAFKGMGPIELRFRDERLGENNDGALVKIIEMRGLFPVRRRHRVAFVTSVFDASGENYEPVISALDAFQEPKSRVYQHKIDVGEVTQDQGFIRWVRVGVVLPDVLIPPRGGQRKFAALLRLIDLDDEPEITHGFTPPKQDGVLWSTVLEFQHRISEKGYEEAAEHQNEARALLVKIAMFFAVRDGELIETRASALKKWVEKCLGALPSDRRDSTKETYNRATKEAFAAAMAGELTLSQLTERLNEIGEKSVKYEVIELCFDIAAASGGATSDDLRSVRQIASSFGLKLEEIEKIRDQKIVGIVGGISNQASIEEVLGIEADWSPEQIKRHLRDEFQKWNNRISTLPEGSERESAQQMLDLIAKARKKYG